MDTTDNNERELHPYTIANISTEDITDESRAKMKRDYMSQKEYNIETVNHASKACGPATSQMGHCSGIEIDNNNVI